MNLEYFKAEVRKQLSSKENKALYAQRKIDVETVFGHLKANLAFTRFSVRGKRKVNIEMGLAFMALNFRKRMKMTAPCHPKNKNRDTLERIKSVSRFLVVRAGLLSQPLLLD